MVTNQLIFALIYAAAYQSSAAFKALPIGKLALLTIIGSAYTFCKTGYKAEHDNTRSFFTALPTMLTGDSEESL